MNKTVRNCLLSIGTAVLALGIAACSKEEDKSTIKIALGGPVTGSLAEYGDQVFNGARMAIDQINAKGGVLGRQLEAVVYDDACDPKQAVAVANKIVGDKIAFVVGHTCSSSTQPASDIYEDEGILMVTSSATAPEI